MRSFEEMLELILNTVREDERIRAATMEGSQTAKESHRDQYSDFDITFFVSDIREFVKDRKYMERFGDILIMQCPDDWYCHPYDYDGRENFAYLTQYKDGHRIDLTFVDICNIEKQTESREPRTVLINKDQFAELKDIASDEVFWIKPPTEKEYADACNEFRWVSNYAVKGICRKQLYYAKHMMDVPMMDMFLMMMNWKIGIEHDFQVTTGAYEKYLKNYLTEQEMERFTEIFPNGDYSDMQEKLFLYYDYFAELAQFVAEKCGFEYDEEETENVRLFMENRLRS